MAEILTIWLLIMAVLVWTVLILSLSFFLINKALYFVDLGLNEFKLLKKIKYYLFSFLLISLVVLVMVVGIMIWL